MPRYIITDNDKTFVNKLMTGLYKKFKFVQHKSSLYNAPTNGLAEAFNKSLCNLLSKLVAKSKMDWHEKLGEALGHAVVQHKSSMYHALANGLAKGFNKPL